MLNIALNLERNARYTPEKTLIYFADKSLTYGQVNEAANRVASALVTRGIKPGDKVAISCPNIPQFVMVYYGILKAGAVAVPINVLLTKNEISFHLTDCQAKAYFCFVGTTELPMGQAGYGAFQENADCELFVLIGGGNAEFTPAEVVITFDNLVASGSSHFDTVLSAPEDTAVILYTSGTTGKAKGAELSQMNLLSNAWASLYLLSLSAKDTQLLTLPLFHSFGQTVQMNASVLCGASLVLLARFDAGAIFKLIQKHRVTIFAGVPTMFIGLLNHPDLATLDMATVKSHFRLSVAGGSPLPVTVLQEFESKFEVPVLEGYGLSETSPVATFNHPDRERRAGSVGQAILGAEVNIVDSEGNFCQGDASGEVVIRGPHVMKGYYRRPDATAEAFKNGWFHTGDIGRFDSDGYLYIVDRVKDMIIRGGFNIYPRELEEVMMKHPAIEQVAVVGIPHNVHGEEVKACVKLKPEQQLDEASLISWCQKHMGKHKYPRHVAFYAALPMSATGKILKRELRTMTN